MSKQCIICLNKDDQAAVILDCNFNSNESVHVDCLLKIKPIVDELLVSVVKCPICRQNIVIHFKVFKVIDYCLIFDPQFYLPIKHFIICLIVYLIILSVLLIIRLNININGGLIALPIFLYLYYKIYQINLWCNRRSFQRCSHFATSAPGYLHF